MLIKPCETVLFQGDSITDAGRFRADPAHLGSGYAMIAASWIAAEYPDHNINFINRGISGNRAADLVSRWQQDCIQLAPDWVSIMIGINDTWRSFDENDSTTPESYETSLRICLQQAREKLGCRFILIEPFVLPYPDDRKLWRNDLEPRIEIVKRLAKEFKAILIHMDKIMNEAAVANGTPAYWANDGVHPTPAGHGLLAKHWLKAVAAI